MSQSVPALIIVTLLIYVPFAINAQSSTPAPTASWSYANAGTWDRTIQSCASGSQSPMALDENAVTPGEDIYLRLWMARSSQEFVVTTSPFPVLHMKPKSADGALVLLSSAHRDEMVLTALTLHSPAQHVHPMSSSAVAEMTLHFEPSSSYSYLQYPRISYSFMIAIYHGTSYAYRPSVFDKIVNSWGEGSTVTLTTEDLRTLSPESVLDYDGSQPFPPCRATTWYLSNTFLYSHLNLTSKIPTGTVRPTQSRLMRTAQRRTVRGTQYVHEFAELDAREVVAAAPPSSSSPSAGNSSALVITENSDKEDVKDEYVAALVVLSVLAAVIIGTGVFLSTIEFAARRNARVVPGDDEMFGDFSNIQGGDDAEEDEDEDDEEE
eukprot:PhM_4_TR1350/c0_g1_i1/m.63416